MATTAPLLSDTALAEVLRHVPASGTPTVEPVDHPFDTPTAAGAVRVGAGGTSVFVKVVRHYRHWPLFPTLPPAVRARAVAGPQWRYEADVYTSGVGAALPDGLRLPAVHAVVDLGDDRLAIVMEDVAVAGDPWDTARFARAATLLGRAAVRLTRSDALPPSASRVPGEITRLHYEARLLPADLPVLADDRTWRHPLLAPHRALRADLAELAGRVPRVLDEAAGLPQLMIHGDASPQNLLVPADRPDTFVAIDWTLGGLAAAGDDLGQLLVGLAHAGTLPVDALPALRTTVVEAFTAGLRAEDPDGGWDAVTVRHGLDAGLLVRSTFSAIPLERLGEPLTDEVTAAVTARIALARYLADLGLAL